MLLPSFADQVSKTFTDKQITYEKTGFNPRGIGGFNTSFNATEKTDTVTTKVTLTSIQIQTLKDTQNKLATLIDKISGLKSKYANLKTKGLLNALDQFEKQANQLNNEISAFILNPNGDINGKINSFVKREAALENKVNIKEGLLEKMSTKQVNDKKQNNGRTDSADNSVNEQKNKKQNKKINKKNK
jgi:hypothetical protein